jgi:hypothetical protein
MARLLATCLKEPTQGIEPRARCLQNSSSTNELSRLDGRASHSPGQFHPWLGSSIDSLARAQRLRQRQLNLRDQIARNLSAGRKRGKQRFRVFARQIDRDVVGLDVGFKR